MTVSLEDFSRAIVTVHEAAADPEQWLSALDAVMRVMQVEKGGMFDLTGADQVSITAQGHVIAAYMQHYMRLDPTLTLLMKASTRGVRKL